jgi:predicted metal-dependent phosphoesterase TrpH
MFARQNSQGMNELLTPILEYETRAGRDGRPIHVRRQAARIDLHCHSTFSVEHIRWVPGVVYYPLLEPEEIYDLAKARGMDFVTITDHDTIDGCKALLDRRGELADFIFGEEVTTRLPEDGTIVHVNVFDIDEAQHAEIQRLRGNLYELVAYLRRIDRLFVLNHPTWTAQHRALERRHIEAMLELFDVFEGLNGSRSYAHNAFAWHATRGRGKVLVAGSDSHTHRVGTTYTLSAGSTTAELLAGIRAGNSALCGSFGTPEKLREDVWITMHKTAERRINAAGNAWERLVCRGLARLGRTVCPLVCLGYHTRQNVLIRDSLRALPA